MDIDKFLQEVYDLCAQDKTGEALDLIFNTMCMRSLEEMPYELMNEIQGKIDITKLDYSATLTFLTQTCKYDKVIPNHIILFKKFEKYLQDKKETPERIRGLLEGLETSGNYWEDMKSLGSPEWLSGHNPNIKTP